jgi:glycosyltransferase involved in cell wall biosynthesis
VVPFDEIHEYFKKADVLTNTSLFEGFPHAFIQAWAYQVPIVSLSVNPDGLLTKYNLGFCSNSVEQMITDIEKILSNETLCRELKLNGIKYVTENHDMDKIINFYIELFYAL